MSIYMYKMLIITNLITFFNFLYNKFVGFLGFWGVKTNEFIEFEYVKGDCDEEYCNCNMCYIIRNIMFCFTRLLVYRKI